MCPGINHVKPVDRILNPEYEINYASSGTLKKRTHAFFPLMLKYIYTSR